MIQTIRNAWSVPELRKKILFTIFALLIFRLGSAIPVPDINSEQLGFYLEAQSGTILGLRSEHPALYQQLHYHPAADGGHS